MSETTGTKRPCGECDVCCRGWLRINTDEIKIKVGEECPHISDVGCGNYENRAVNPCRTFFCGWASTDSPLPDWMQPHKSKAIVLYNAIIWNGISLDQVVPVGEEIPKETLEWLMNFSRTHKRPAIFAKNELINGKLSGKSHLMIFAEQPLKGQIEAWCQAGGNLLDNKS